MDRITEQLHLMLNIGVYNVDEVLDLAVHIWGRYDEICERLSRMIKVVIEGREKVGFPSFSSQCECGEVFGTSGAGGE